MTEAIEKWTGRIRSTKLIEQGKLHTLNGSKLTPFLQQALGTQNGDTLYQVDDNVSIMLEQQRIPCEQIPDWI